MLQEIETTFALPVMAMEEQEPCEECLGTGGWERYEPGCEPHPGVRYLTCVQCRGRGRLLPT